LFRSNIRSKPDTACHLWQTAADTLKHAQAFVKLSVLLLRHYPNKAQSRMLKIGKLTDYGVVVLDQLARAGAVKQSTESIGEATGLPLPTVRKVMKALVDGGLVIAQRGSKGGYRLARAPEQIRILDVVQAFEGPVALTECSTEDHQCDITAHCSLSSSWGGINTLMMRVLARVTLEDIRKPELQDRLYRELTDQSDRIQLINL